MISAVAAVWKYGRKSQPEGYLAEFSDYSQSYIIVVTTGSLQVDHGDVRNIVRPGCGVILPRGADFILSTPTQPYRGHFVEYQPGTVEFPLRVVLLGKDRSLRRAVDDIEAEYRAEGPGSVLAECYAILGMRCLRLAQGQAGANGDGSELCLDIERLLRAHLFTADHLDTILNGLPCSRRHAARVYKAQRGHTIKAAQTAMKLQAAQELLTQTDLSVTAIAMELGFPSSQHFATMMRRALGCTPSEVRAGK